MYRGVGGFKVQRGWWKILKKTIINLKQVLFSYIVVVFLAMFVVNGIRISLAVQVKANYQLRSCVKFE